MKILAISKKVFLELLRDKRTLILLFIAPVFIMWLMNAAFSANTETNVSIAAVDVSDSIVKSLDDVEHIEAKDYKTESKANEALKDEKVDAVLIFKDENDYQVVITPGPPVTIYAVQGGSVANGTMPKRSSGPRLRRQ